MVTSIQYGGRKKREDGDLYPVWWMEDKRGWRPLPSMVEGRKERLATSTQYGGWKIREVGDLYPVWRTEDKRGW